MKKNHTVFISLLLLLMMPPAGFSRTTTISAPVQIADNRSPVVTKQQPIKTHMINDRRYWKSRSGHLLPLPDGLYIDAKGGKFRVKNGVVVDANGKTPKQKVLELKRIK